MVKQYLTILILLLAFVVRLYGFSNPLADWHSWRQVDTSAVSRNFVEHGFDVLHPRFDDLSNVPSGKENPQGYRFVEFPIFNLAQAGGYVLFNTIPLEQWGRLVTIFSSVLSTLFIYLIVRRHADDTGGLFAAFFYAILPFNMYYGRTILPDPTMVMAVLGGIYFFDKWIENSSKFKVQNVKFDSNKAYFYFITSILFTAAAFLLKPYALIFTLPMVVLAYQALGVKMFRTWQLWLFVIVALVPLIWWRWWMLQFPEGIPASDWLFNGGNIRFKGAFFYWLFADRLARLILGYWGMGLFIIGLLVNSNKHHLKKHGVFFYAFIISSLLYMTIIARGNVQHDYYQILIIPSIAIFLGLGARTLLYPPKEFINPWISRVILACCIAFSVGFGWYFVRDYYNINNRAILTAGKAVSTMTPKDAKVIAPYDGDTTFLYQTERKGWASFEHSLPEMIANYDAEYLVLVNPQEKDLEIGKTYEIIGNTKEYLLFKLK